MISNFDDDLVAGLKLTDDWDVHVIFSHQRKKRKELVAILGSLPKRLLVIGSMPRNCDAGRLKKFSFIIIIFFSLKMKL